MMYCARFQQILDMPIWEIYDGKGGGDFIE